MQIGMQLSITRAGGQLTLVQQALSVLRKYGTDAHLWMPGVGYVNGVTASNWIDSAGTQAGAVDQPVGLVRPAGYSNTNLLTFSERFDNAAWIVSNATVTPNAVTAPNGTLTADKLVENTSATITHYVFQAFTPNAATTYTFSVYLKAAERGFAFVGFNLGSIATTFVSVNLSTGAVSTATGTPLASSSASEGNGWWRVSVTQASTGTTGTTVDVRVSTDGLWGNRAYTGNGTSGIYAWGAELEVGSSATTYTPSMGITANQSTTANKPILRQTSGRYSWQFDGTDDRLSLSSVPFQMADNHCVVASYSATSLAVQADIFSIRSNVATNPIALLRLSTGGVVQALHRDDAGTLQTVNSTGSVGTNTAFVAAMRRNAGVVIARRNGGNQGTGSQAFGATSFTSAAIGASPTSPLNSLAAGNIGPVIAIKGTVSDADLLTLEKFVGACSGVTI